MGNPKPERSEQAGAVAPACNEEDAPSQKEPYRPYSRKARLWAWVGIAFMVFLTVMYAYAFASGIILTF